MAGVVAGGGRAAEFVLLMHKSSVIGRFAGAAARAIWCVDAHGAPCGANACSPVDQMRSQADMLRVLGVRAADLDDTLRYLEHVVRPGACRGEEPL